MKPLDKLLSTSDLFITANVTSFVNAGNISKMKDNAIICNIEYSENEHYDIIGLEGVNGVTRESLKPYVDRYVFPNGHWVVVMSPSFSHKPGDTPGNANFAISCSFTNHVLASIELWRSKDSRKYSN